MIIHDIGRFTCDAHTKKTRCLEIASTLRVSMTHNALSRSHLKYLKYFISLYFQTPISSHEAALQEHNQHLIILALESDTIVQPTITRHEHS